ncbi:MAG: hypothetical protein K6B52_09560 [Clostridiales bacterium]|nr:hypothetical protein [Clostridiales bacterium]
MIDSKKVLLVAREMYGISGDDSELLPISRYTCLCIDSMLKDGVDPDDVRVVCLAACRLAIASLSRKGAADDGIIILRVGDVTVKSNSDAAKKNLENEYARLKVHCVPVMKDSAFAFAGVSSR